MPHAVAWGIFTNLFLQLFCQHIRVVAEVVEQSTCQSGDRSIAVGQSCVFVWVVVTHRVPKIEHIRHHLNVVSCQWYVFLKRADVPPQSVGIDRAVSTGRTGEYVRRCYLQAERKTARRRPIDNGKAAVLDECLTDMVIAVRICIGQAIGLNVKSGNLAEVADLFLSKRKFVGASVFGCCCKFALILPQPAASVSG